MMTTYTEKQITAIGGRPWTSSDGSKNRVYINADVWMPLVGLETTHYNTGNISGATLNGEEISNAAARDILNCISKVYWDEADGQIHILVYPNRYSDRVPGWIRDAIAQTVANLPSDDDTPTGDQPSQIVEKLRQAGRTARDIAEMVGVSVSTIYRWARNACRPLPINAAALAALI